MIGISRLYMRQCANVIIARRALQDIMVTYMNTNNQKSWSYGQKVQKECVSHNSGLVFGVANKTAFHLCADTQKDADRHADSSHGVQ